MPACLFAGLLGCWVTGWLAGWLAGLHCKQMRTHTHTHTHSHTLNRCGSYLAYATEGGELELLSTQSGDRLAEIKLKCVLSACACGCVCARVCAHM